MRKSYIESRLTNDLNQMTVSGVRGTTEVRNIYIRANATIQDLYMVPLDLKKSDGNGVLSASSMTIQQTSVKQGTSKEVSVVVGFNLAKVPFLGITGFNQLYVDQPVFGASPVKDYFSLLVWGFGAEATRGAVAKVVQGWALPRLK
jgi:hypothetical protein